MYPARHLRHPTTLNLAAIRRQDTMRIPFLALGMGMLTWFVIALGVMLVVSR